MRAPLSWIKEYAALPEGVSARDVAEKLISVGLEVETVEEVTVTGPLLVGRVLEIEELARKGGRDGVAQPRGDVAPVGRRAGPVVGGRAAVVVQDANA